MRKVIEMILKMNSTKTEILKVNGFEILCMKKYQLNKNSYRKISKMNGTRQEKNV